MDRLIQELGLRPGDLILLGVVIGQWLAHRSRRDQGRRIGQLEKLLAARAASGKREQ
jgi:hypothetical protein